MVAEESERHEDQNGTERDAGDRHHAVPRRQPARVTTVQRVHRRVVDCVDRQSSTPRRSFNQSKSIDFFSYLDNRTI